MTIDCRCNLLFRERTVEDEPAKSDLKSCTVSEFTVSGGKYVGAAVGYSYGTTSVDGFDGQMTWDGSESREQVGADESVKLEELK